VALKKPSDLFGNKADENNISVIESDSSFREELIKVESLSEQVTQLQQELSQKVIKSDLESLVLSQINTMQENFEYLQNDFKKSNKKDIVEFKEKVSELTEIVGNLVENELPKYKKQVTKNEVRISNQFTDFKEEIGERIKKFYEVLNEFNDVVQVIDTVSNIENYIQEHHQDLVHLREEVFGEIEKLPVGNLQENLERLEKKIDFIKETYSKIEPEIIVREVIKEGLLNEPPDTKNSDPLTPLDQNFVTLDQLQEHYRLFINRIQQQLSTLGGGGETRLRYLDDIVGIQTNSAAYNGKYLQWNSATNKAEFVAVSGGGGSQTLNQTLGFGNTSSLGMSVGIITATEFYGDGSGLTNLPGGGESYWASTSAGINTLSNVGIGTTNSILALTVVGDGFFTGVVSIGTTNIPSTLIVDGDIYVSGTVSTDGLFVNDVGIFSSSSLIVANQSGTYGYIIAGDEITDNYTLKFPIITSDTGIAVTGIAQTFTALQTFNNGIKVGVNTSQGLILTSPNGTKYRLIVDNSGALDTVLVP
jgi:hypothetical protein